MYIMKQIHGSNLLHITYLWQKPNLAPKLKTRKNTSRDKLFWEETWRIIPLSKQLGIPHLKAIHAIWKRNNPSYRTYDHRGYQPLTCPGMTLQVGATLLMDNLNLCQLEAPRFYVVARFDGFISSTTVSVPKNPHPSRSSRIDGRNIPSLE